MEALRQNKNLLLPMIRLNHRFLMGQNFLAPPKLDLEYCTGCEKNALVVEVGNPCSNEVICKLFACNCFFKRQPRPSSNWREETKGCYVTQFVY